MTVSPLMTFLLVVVLEHHRVTNTHILYLNPTCVHVHMLDALVKMSRIVETGLLSEFLLYLVAVQSERDK